MAESPDTLRCDGLPFVAVQSIPPTRARELHARIAHERRWSIAGRITLALLFIAVTLLTAAFAFDARDPEGRPPPGALVVVFFAVFLLGTIVVAGVALALLFPRTRKGQLATLVLVGATVLFAYLADLTDAVILGAPAGCLGIALACIGVGHLLGVPFAPLSLARLRLAQRDLAAGTSWRFAGDRIDPSLCDELDHEDAPPLGDRDEDSLPTIAVTLDILPNAAIVIDGHDLQSTALRPITAHLADDPAAVYRGHDDRVPLPTRPMIASERLELRERLRLHDASTICGALAIFGTASFVGFAIFQSWLAIGAAELPLGVAAGALATALVSRGRLRHRARLVADLRGDEIAVRDAMSTAAGEPFEVLPRSGEPWTYPDAAHESERGT